MVGPRHKDVPSVLAAQEAAASHSAQRSHTKWPERVESNRIGREGLHVIPAENRESRDLVQDFVEFLINAR